MDTNAYLRLAEVLHPLLKLTLGKLPARQRRHAAKDSERDGVILVEIKHQINDLEGNAAAKASAKHPRHGSVLMFYWNESASGWRVVTYDVTYGKNTQERTFRVSMLRTY